MFAFFPLQVSERRQVPGSQVGELTCVGRGLKFPSLSGGDVHDPATAPPPGSVSGIVFGQIAKRVSIQVCG